MFCFMSCREFDLFTISFMLVLLVTVPLFVLYFHTTCIHYQCALTVPVLDIHRGELSLMALWEKIPSITWDAVTIATIWMTVQVRSPSLTNV